MPTPAAKHAPEHHKHVAETLPYLRDAVYPAVREQLLEWARDRAAPQVLLLRLEALPERRYDHEAQVTEALRRLPADPRDTFELPLLNYDELATEEITRALDSLTEAQVRKVYDHEKQTKRRLVILHACEHRMHEKLTPPQ